MGDDVPESSFITPAEVEKAKGLADAKFLRQIEPTDEMPAAPGTPPIAARVGALEERAAELERAARQKRVTEFDVARAPDGTFKVRKIQTTEGGADG